MESRLTKDTTTSIDNASITPFPSPRISNTSLAEPLNESISSSLQLHLSNGIEGGIKMEATRCVICHNSLEEIGSIANRDICLACANNRKSRHQIKLCPMPKCRTAKHKVKRLKPIPSKLFEISSPLKEKLFSDLSQYLINFCIFIQK